MSDEQERARGQGKETAKQWDDLIQEQQKEKY